MRGEVRVDGVAGDHGVEASGATVGLGTQDASEALGLLLARAERPRHLDGDAGLGKVDGEVGDLGHDEHAHRALAELLEQSLALLDRGLAGDDRGVEAFAELVQLVEVLPDDEHVLLGVTVDESLDDAVLAVRRRGQSIALFGLRGGVDESLALVEGDAYLDAVGRGDVALRLDVLPGRVVPLGSDEGEDVVLAAVLAYEGGGEAETPTRLDIGGKPEDRCGEQVHLVVEDQAPVARVEELEVGVDALTSGGHHLVGRDRDGADVLDCARVFADLGVGERRALEQLGAPLSCGHRVGHEDERGRRGHRHRGRADDGFPRAAGEYDDTGAAVPEALGGLTLIGAQLPTLFAQRDGVSLAVDVPGEVLSRPPELEKDLLEMTALGRVDDDSLVVDARADEWLHLLAAQHLLEHGAVERLKDEAVGRVHVKLQAPVAAHGVGHVDEQGVRHGIARVAQEDVHDALGVVAGGARVPEAERGQAVGVHVLGGALELGEGSDRVAAVGGQGMVDLQEQGLVALHDQGAVGHPPILPPPGRPCSRAPGLAPAYAPHARGGVL